MDDRQPAMDDPAVLKAAAAPEFTRDDRTFTVRRPDGCAAEEKEDLWCKVGHLPRQGFTSVMPM
jgi:hypothetical protein